MGELIIMTGPPGAGKSTVARLLAAKFNQSVLVVGDDFFRFIARGYQDPWRPEAHRQNTVVVGAAAAAAGWLATGDYYVVYDGVIGPWFLDHFMEATGLPHVHYAVLLPPEAVCIERVRSRSGHGFTDLDATRHMYAEFAESQIDQRHLVADGHRPETTARAIADRVAGGSLLRSTGQSTTSPDPATT